VGICLWINVDVAPRAQVKMKDALYTMATSNPLAMFSSDKVIDEFPGRKIYVERNNGPALENILVYEMNDDAVPVKVVFARRGLLKTDRENNQLLLALSDARFEQRDDQEPTNFLKIKDGITAQETTFPISLQELYEKNKKRKGLTALTSRELVERLNQEKETQAAKDNPRKQAAERSSARTEVSKRFSFAMASLAFGLIGVPLAMTAHRKETSIGFLLSIVVAFSYIFLIIIIDGFRSRPELYPEYLIWAPNLIFGGLGLWLFLRLSRR
jgi:lipopolysaccharide export system permease protein